MTESDNKIFYDSEPIIVVKIDVLPDKIFFIHLNDAITRGKIISKISNNPLYKTAELLTRDIMITCCLRVNKFPITDDVFYYISKLLMPIWERNAMITNLHLSRLKTNTKHVWKKK